MEFIISVFCVKVGIIWIIAIIYRHNMSYWLENIGAY